ncbi:hypothetical protein [Phenylobacterium sp.]|uniref:DUF4870 family protein n=1 Tax=Phenylobacterium sp. TaxID=1871053 RepID=UPI00286E818B|nr:hypothetical protein [Phenylobacterium sp.]
MIDDHGATEDRTMPAVVYGLYLLAFATGVTAIIGLVIAYAQRGAAGPTMRSHYTYLIRTFWGGLLMMVAGGVLFAVGALLAIILIGFPIMGVAWLIFAVATIWYAVRCIIGLVYLSRGVAHPRPYAVLA